MHSVVPHVSETWLVVIALERNVIAVEKNDVSTIDGCEILHQRRTFLQSCIPWAKVYRVEV